MKSVPCKFLFVSVAWLSALLLSACASNSSEEAGEAYVASEHRTGSNLRSRGGDGLKQMSQEEIDTLKSRASISGKGPSN
jgi:hypothetical protein